MLLARPVPQVYRSIMLSEFTNDVRYNCFIFPGREAPMVSLSDGSRVPQQFSAMIFRPALSFTIGVYIEPDGSALCTSISCTAEVEGERPWITDVMANLPDMGLRGWVRYAVAIAAKSSEPDFADLTQWPEVPTDMEAETAAREHWRGIAESWHKQPTRRRNTTTIDRLREAAMYYNAAEAAGRHDPAVAVGEAMNLSTSGAKKLLMRCRKTVPPLLPPYERRRAKT